MSVTELQHYRRHHHRKNTRGWLAKCSFCDDPALYSWRTLKVVKGRPVATMYALCISHAVDYLPPAQSFLVPSDTEPGVEYLVNYGSDSEPWLCTCPRFMYSKRLPLGDVPTEDLKAANGWCKHLERKRRELAGLPDLTADGKYCDSCGGEWARGECSCRGAESVTPVA